MTAAYLSILLIFSGTVHAAVQTRPSSSLFDFSKIITIDDILSNIRTNRTDCHQIARLFLARIRLYNGRLGAVTVLNYRGALADARQLDTYRKRSRGRLFGRLHCVPTLIKDNILVAGLPTTLGLWIFSNSTAKVDASAVWRLKSEGALIVGKANLSPFSFGLKSPDEASEITGQCSNPYSITGGEGARVYGSSCGNAVGQAARLAVIGLATDTAGSVTWPASVCGLVGVRPASKIYVSDGVFPLLKNAGDTVAPVTSTVSDALLMLDILSNSNRTSRNSLFPLSHTRSNSEPYRIGIIPDFLYSRSDSRKSITRMDGTKYEYYVDQEIFAATQTFLVQLGSTANVTVVNLTINSDEFIDQIHKIHRVWSDVFACVPQWVDAFFKRYPFLVKSQNLKKEIRTLDDFLAADGVPSHYRRFFQLFTSHRSHCLPSLRKLRKIRSSAKRFLQKRIFETDDIDAIVFPRPHHLPASTVSPADHILMLDPAGAFNFPAMTIPIGYSSRKIAKDDRRRYSPATPVGIYLMTRPRKFKAMLAIARLYEMSKKVENTESYLPPEFV